MTGGEQTNPNDLHRRAFFKGAVAGAAGLALPATAWPQTLAGQQAVEEVERRTTYLRSETIQNVVYVDVAEGPAAVQAAVDQAERAGFNKVVVHGQQAEWNQPVYLPDNCTLEFLDGVRVTSSMTAAAANPFAVRGGTIGAALITNRDHAGGNRNIKIRGGHFDFRNVTDESLIWAPIWLSNCDDSLFDSITVENVVRNYGLMFVDCRDSTMVDCVARNIAYDGIALRLDCRRVDVYRCEAYECGGPGIQAATFGRGQGAPNDVSFINCRTPESIFVHGYVDWGGARGVLIHGCTARSIAMIGEVRDFTVTSCKTSSVGLSSLSETIRNGRIDSVSFSDLYGGSGGFATRLRSIEGLVENITFSNCIGRDYDGSSQRFGETLLDAGAAARYIDYVNCAFDGDGAGGERSFFQHHTEGRMSNLRLHGCKVWNVDRVLSGPIADVRIRDCELHNVREMHDGRVTDLVLRDNDDW